jgi:hypothetical protein
MRQVDSRFVHRLPHGFDNANMQGAVSKHKGQKMFADTAFAAAAGRDGATITRLGDAAGAIGAFPAAAAPVDCCGGGLDPPLYTDTRDWSCRTALAARDCCDLRGSQLQEAGPYGNAGQRAGTVTTASELAATSAKSAVARLMPRQLCGNSRQLGRSPRWRRMNPRRASRRRGNLVATRGNFGEVRAPADESAGPADESAGGRFVTRQRARMPRELLRTPRRQRMRPRRPGWRSGNLVVTRGNFGEVRAPADESAGPADESAAARFVTRQRARMPQDLLRTPRRRRMSPRGGGQSVGVGG